MGGVPRPLPLLVAIAVSAAAAGPAHAAVLHGQLDNETTAGSPSYKELAGGGVDALTADDFTVPDGKVWTIDAVQAHGPPSGTIPPPPVPVSYNVLFFRSAGSAPESAAIFSQTPPPPAPPTTSPNLPLSPAARLASGHYWVAVQGNTIVSMPWTWKGRSVQNESPAAFRASPSAPWGPKAACPSPGCEDQAFELSGTESNAPPSTLPGSGNGGSGGGAGAGADKVSPVFTGRAAAQPSTFAVDRAGAAVKKGTVFVYSLSEAARVTFTVQRKSAGRKVGRSCRKPTRRNKAKRRCSRYVRAGAFAAQAAAGANRRPFSGMIGSRSLKPARYRALLVATDAAGNRSKPKSVGFRVIRARRR